jgi:hypothetical protein
MAKSKSALRMKKYETGQIEIAQGSIHAHSIRRTFGTFNEGGKRLFRPT